MDTSQTDRLGVLADQRFSWRVAGRTLLTVAVCYLAARLGGILIINTPQKLWPLWPGCAVLVAIVLISPRKSWPILIPAGLAGFVLYDFPAGVPLHLVSILLLADIVEVSLAVWGIDYLLNGAVRLDSLKSFGKYALVTVILGPFVSSLVGIQALNVNRWMSWWNNVLSDGLAFLTIAPAILGWASHFRSKPRASRVYYLEALAVMTGLFFLSLRMFVVDNRNVSPALLYSLVPFMLWSAIRFGSAGAGTAASIVSLVSIWGAIHGRGPFTEADPIDRVLTLQLFLLFTAVPFMTLAVLVEERKRQATAVRESEERFRLLADSSPTLIWMSGIDRMCNFFNRGWLDFTGRSLLQELGDGWVSGVHSDDRARCLATYGAAFDQRTAFEMEYRLRRHDGEYRWIVDLGVPRFGSNGVFCGYIGSCVDITERKLSEISLHELTGRLMRAQEEERAHIARELHDDISQRMAFLQIGLEQFEQKMPVLGLSDRKELRNLTEVASEISSDLHSISHQLHPSRLDLQGLVAATASLCREMSHQHDLQIEFIHRDVPGEIPTDIAICLFRIVQEALRNVVRHSNTSNAEVELMGHGDSVGLCISDSGTGFDLEGVKQKGGLGLVSMTERLRLIGGDLSIASRPSRGTQLRVRVPLPKGSPDLTSESKHFKANA
ncbi:MAG TPA: MASE1 domain-containing protein [Dongiaceae bacterium]|nr:MASE1 domain-containing protein [Dongiaceae bacterium]